MAATPRQPDPPARRSLRWLWLLLAYAALGLAALGIVLPGLPTTPFVLLAAFAAARGSRRLHDRLHAHRHFGPLIRDWDRYRAVSRAAKRNALAAMALCALLVVLTAPRWWMAALAAGSMALVAAWLWRRPEPPQAGQGGAADGAGGASPAPAPAPGAQRNASARFPNAKRDCQ